MTPEEKARKHIDHQLAQCGWIVQHRDEMNIMAGLGVAVREFPLKTGFADYLLYVDGRVAGVVEAKPEGHTLSGVEVQSAKYNAGLPDNLPHYHLPLPFAYESTGKLTQFTNSLEPYARSRDLFTFHQPAELQRLVELEGQLRGNLREMPVLNTEGLWKLKIETLTNLEKSLAENRPRSLIQMATGSGKTLTAVVASYRLIKFAKANRILFLVDRNNLGKQTLNEYQQYVSPYNGYKFTEEFNVQHLRKNLIDPASKVCITTIQRLYSMLSGEDEYLEENEESSLFESEPSTLLKEPLPVVYNERIPIEMFDVIIIDECHRSIYNIWRQVLDYFDAFLIGLTATPTAQTIGFFGGNLVQEFTHEKAVAAGINVGYDVYRIETQITSAGATLSSQPDVFVPHRDRRTKQTKFRELDNDLTYTANQLDRDIVALDQIRLVIKTFKEKLFTEIFPGRTEVPKTLVFAKTDLHAEDIVKIIREEFGKGNDFCQKITSKTTGKKPEDLLAEFRNAYNPRIAVTVDMIATGTDVKPLECLLFMRNIKSAGYFEQMKGRGCRIIDSDSLQSVTPDAKHKTHFVIVDAVGVCEQDKTASKPLDRKPSVSLDKILAAVAAGVVDADVVSTLSARLARLEQELDDDQQAAITQAAGGVELGTLAGNLLTSIDPDVVLQSAVETFDIPDGEEPTAEQTQQAEQDCMKQAVKPFHDPKLRDAILNTRRALDQVIDEQTRDVLIDAKFDAVALEKARSLVTTFRQFIEDHKEEIEALQILYSRPYRAGLRYGQVKELAQAIQQPPLSANAERLWQAFRAVEPERVPGLGGKQLVDVIALVRHALDPQQLLVPIGTTVEQRYQDWLAEQSAAGATFTAEQRQWLDAIKDHIAGSLSIEEEDFGDVPFNQLGGLGHAYELFGDRLSEILEELNARLAA
ncbi:Type I restriction enzyme R protein [Symmachiella dynata]|uniref:Type I restriction enzyme R protein n=1 Tax=Symmachiella dynata TaxID=2527995 RepID=A0A517ZP96_9PLAN|nr:type I restriction-modification enzyme R subunit C-terminal domain-containing protein [Symmachiella dynata]QDU44302.1 Type I restriction enzyme R protein [Symmachiella dynata]